MAYAHQGGFTVRLLNGTGHPVAYLAGGADSAGDAQWTGLDDLT